MIDLAKVKGVMYSMKHNTYAEQYLNTVQIAGSTARKYHDEKYGKPNGVLTPIVDLFGSPYKKYYFDEFVKEFDKTSMTANIEEMAEVIKKSGAKYSILTSKHHDGVSLYPTKIEHPEFKYPLRTSRDLVGDWVKAVNQRGVIHGLYYSPTYEWSITGFYDGPVKAYSEIPSKKYGSYFESQMRELNNLYHPSIFWTDNFFAAGYSPINLKKDIINNYEPNAFAKENGYNQIAINGRWQYPKRLPHKIANIIAEIPVVKEILDLILSEVNKGPVSNEIPDDFDEATNETTVTGPPEEILATGGQQPEGILGILFNESLVGFKTPEYNFSYLGSGRVNENSFFEMTLGSGYSFGYNENQKKFMGADELIHLIIRASSRNGNVLFNIGPDKYGNIREEERVLLEQVGKWLEVNSSAIYKTRAWSTIRKNTNDQVEIRFTQNKEQNLLNAIFIGGIKSNSFYISNFNIVNENLTAKVLGYDLPLETKNEGGNLFVNIPFELSESMAHVIQFTSNTPIVQDNIPSIQLSLNKEDANNSVLVHALVDDFGENDIAETIFKLNGVKVENVDSEGFINSFSFPIDSNNATYTIASTVKDFKGNTNTNTMVYVDNTNQDVVEKEIINKFDSLSIEYNNEATELIEIENRMINSGNTSELNTTTSVYPNPANDFITISCPDNFYNVDIFQVAQGKLIYYKSDINEKNFRINVSNWVEGLYIVKITSKTGLVEIKKIIVKH